MNRRFCFALLLSVFVNASLPEAKAVEAVAQGSDLQRFNPSMDPLGGFAARSGDILAPEGYVVGLHVNYARNPLVVRERGERVAATLQNVVALQVHGAIHATSFLQLGFGIPVVLYQNGTDPRVTGIPAQAFGDLELEARFRLMTQEEYGVALSLSPGIRIPVGNDQAFAGGGRFTFAPRVSVSRAFDRFSLTGDLWFNVRPEVEVLRYTTVGNELGLRVAGGFAVTEALDVIVELDGGLAFATASNGVAGTPLELLAGVRQRVHERFAVEFGAGLGLMSAPGTPDFRIVAGVSFGRGFKATGAGLESDMTDPRAIDNSQQESAVSAETPEEVTP